MIYLRKVSPEGSVWSFFINSLSFVLKYCRCKVYIFTFVCVPPGHKMVGANERIFSRLPISTVERPYPCTSLYFALRKFEIFNTPIACWTVWAVGTSINATPFHHVANVNFVPPSGFCACANISPAVKPKQTIRAVALDGTRAKTLLVKYIVAL